MFEDGVVSEVVDTLSVWDPAVGLVMPLKITRTSSPGSIDLAAEEEALDHQAAGAEAAADDLAAGDVEDLGVAIAGERGAAREGHRDAIRPDVTPHPTS